MPERGGYNTRRYCRVHAWDCPHASTGECIDAHPIDSPNKYTLREFYSLEV